MADISSDYTLRQLRYFVTAAAERSTLAAANAMFVSQSALSQGLTDLENALGAQLFLRHRGRGIELTEIGRQLLPLARQLLGDADDLRSAASDLQQELRGSLTIACFDVIAASILPRVLSGFAARHPEVTTDFIDGDQEKLLDALETGRAELAITFEGSVPPSLVQAVLARPMPHLLIPPGHRLASTSPVSLQQVADEPFILVDADSAIDWVGSAFRAAGIAPHVRFRSRSLSTVRALVAHGFGVTLVAQGSRHDGLVAPDGVIAVPVADMIPPDPIVIVRMAGAQLTRRASAFWDFCLEELG